MLRSIPDRGIDLINFTGFISNGADSMTGSVFRITESIDANDAMNDGV